jgi:hypothetical protein
MYYGIGALNFCIPILQAGFFVSNTVFSGILLIATDFLFIFTAVILSVALLIIKRSFDAETRIAANIKEMSLHIAAFWIFALSCTVIVIYNLIIIDTDANIAGAIKMIGAMIVASVLNTVCGLILMYIFLKIYIEVKDGS